LNYQIYRFQLAKKIPLSSHWMDSVVSIIVKDYF